MNQLLCAELARQFLEDGSRIATSYVRNEDFAILDDPPQEIPPGQVVEITLSFGAEPGIGLLAPMVDDKR